MAVDTARYDVPFRAPALPYAPVTYDQEAFEQFTQETFATDRDLVPKGMIEVVL